jgi:hypothetical protein
MEVKPELRLPTTAVPVALHLVVGGKVDAEVFVAEAPRTGHSQLLEDVATLLDEPVAFMPIRVAGAIRLYAKAAVRFISIARAGDEDADSDFDDGPSEVITLYDRQHNVSVEVIGEPAIEGMLFDSSPSDRPRVADHLNGRGRFVRVWTEHKHYLINKDQIIRVSEQEPS